MFLVLLILNYCIFIFERGELTMTCLYKLFLNHTNKFLLKKYDGISQNYLKFIDENRLKGNRQVIINSRLILMIAEVYIEKQFNINVIDVSENSLIDIKEINLKNINNIDKLNEIKNNLFNFKDEYFIEINSISISDYNYDNDILIRSNGIIEIDGLEIEKCKNDLIEIFNSVLLKIK